jgi:hypothetical protein
VFTFYSTCAQLPVCKCSVAAADGGVRGKRKTPTSKNSEFGRGASAIPENPALLPNSDIQNSENWGGGGVGTTQRNKTKNFLLGRAPPPILKKANVLAELIEIHAGESWQVSQYQVLLLDSLIQSGGGGTCSSDTREILINTGLGSTIRHRRRTSDSRQLLQVHLIPPKDILSSAVLRRRSELLVSGNTFPDGVEQTGIGARP